MSTQFSPPEPTQTMNTVIRNVTQKTVNKKDGSGSITLFEVHVDAMSDPLVTSNKRLANECYDLKDQRASIDYIVKQNGAFTNYYVNAAVPSVNGSADSFSPEAQQFAENVAQDRIPSSDMSGSNKDLDIHRQTATKVAAWLVGPGGNPHEFWANVDTLVSFYETGEKPPDVDIPF